MFTEVREMIDSTVYTNGRSEVTAQNVNLAMHGIVDATEEKIGEVEGNISEITTDINDLKVQIEESANSAVGLTFQFPMFLLQELALPGMSINNLQFTPELIELVGQEMPSWVEPLTAMISENQRVFTECINAFAEKKELPIININLTTGADLMLELEGVAGVYNVTSYFSPSTVLMATYSGLGEMQMTASMDGYSVEIVASSDGYIALTVDSGEFDIPAPGMAAIDNSQYLDTINSDAYSNRYHTYEYVYGSGYSEKYFITPLIVTKDVSNMYVRFLVGLDILEGVINLTDGMTTSRIVGSITPTN